jgi:hypothetical protein
MNRNEENMGLGLEKNLELFKNKKKQTIILLLAVFSALLSNEKRTSSCCVFCGAPSLLTIKEHL